MYSELIGNYKKYKIKSLYDNILTIESPSNQIRIFKNNMAELGNVLGQLFIPLISKVLPILNGITVALKRLTANIAGFFGIKLDLNSFGQGYSELETDIDGVGDSLDNATAAAKKFKTVTLGIDELNINAPQDESGSSSGSVSGGVDLTDEIIKASEEYQKVWNEAFAKIESKSNAIANKVEKFFKPIMDSLKEFAKGKISFGELSADIFSFTITNLEDALIKGLENVDWLAIGESIYDFIANIDYATIFSKAIDLGQIVFTFSPKIEEGLLAKPALDLTALIFGADEDVKDKTWELFKKTKPVIDEAKATPRFTEMIEMLGKLKIAFDIVGDALGIWFENQVNNFELWKATTANTISTWWEEDVSPWFTEEKWLELGTSINIGIAKAWLEFTESWKKTGIYKWWKEDVSPWFTKEKWNFDGIKDGLSSAWNAAVEAIKGIWNKFANWLNDKLTIEIDTSTIIGSGISAVLGTDVIKLGELPTFKNGGFPEDGLFFANHNELVGQFSNGRTAVANNEMIVDGIRYGVREAVSEVLAPYLSQIAQNTRETADKDMSVNIGDREIARANARGQKSLGMRLVTEF